MPSNARRAAIHSISHRPVAERPSKTPLSPTEIYGIYVFNDRVQRQRLPKRVYEALRRTIDLGLELEAGIADSVASAMRDWAVEQGATHFTHWFLPMTGLTAEKHDSFISLTGDDRIINEFSGRELIKGEPDASSFPSGGLRTTFEARGYTAWDPTSPAFLRDGPMGSMTLCIPTAFCSWTGEALDKKTPILRSEEVLSRAALRMLQRLGNDRATRVWSNIGCEQEYFLIDRELANLRPDLLACGRTLFGARTPKGQELADNYFGAISQRALGFMQDVEGELWKLGIPVKTRHNEVAPLQFELAPIYKKTTVATDQNMLIMEILGVVAERHGLRCLLHEKPFAGLNGSGKHTNWSIQDDLGNNLLEPGNTPSENLRFVLFLSAVIRAVDLHADLLRSTIAHAGNEHRLGANEAPPAIISIFLGRELEEVVDAIVGGRTPASRGSDSDIRLGVTTLPSLPRDITDRNRTSPFAFTGNKFEFRAVGASQSVAYPASMLNAIVADSLNVMADEIERRVGKGAESAVAINEVVAETLRAHRRILFSGDNYGDEWTQEAERRGLPNLKETPAAIARFARRENVELLARTGVLSERESSSRQNVLYDNYIQAIRIEAVSTHRIAATMLLPPSLRFQSELAETIGRTRAVSSVDLTAQEELLAKVATLCSTLTRELAALEGAIARLDGLRGELPQFAEFCRREIVPVQVRVRELADALEGVVDDDLWPLPKYHEILFVR